VITEHDAGRIIPHMPATRAIKPLINASRSLGWAFWLPALAVEFLLAVTVASLIGGSLIVAGVSLMLANFVFIFLLKGALSGKYW